MKTNKFIRSFYYFFKRLSNAFKKFFQELFKPKSFLKGEDFENCLRTKVFKKENFELIMKTHDFHENKKDYVESSLYPDYYFRDKNIADNEKNELWVEAKYRENLYKGKIQWCNDKQLARYKEFGKGKEVRIAIGFGGRPKNPEKIYIIPLNEIQYSGLYPNSIAEFEFTDKRKNIIDNLLTRVYNYKK